LLDFKKNFSEFQKRNIQVIAASVDPLEKARETVSKHKLSFIVGYGLNAKEVSAKTGAFYHEKDGYLHATGYIVDPEAKIVNGVYSTMNVGRLVAKDCLGLIDYLRKKQ